MHRHENDASLRIAAPDERGGVNPVQARHRDVGDNHVGLASTPPMRMFGRSRLTSRPNLMTAPSVRLSARLITIRIGMCDAWIRGLAGSSMPSFGSIAVSECTLLG
jgi:hypothetical protein